MNVFITLCIGITIGGLCLVAFAEWLDCRIYPKLALWHRHWFAKGIETKQDHYPYQRTRLP